MTNDWTTDWHQFAKKLVELKEAGMNDFEITEHLSGHDVQWQGRITRLMLDDEYTPGVHLSMGVHNMPMSGGYVLSADHIALIARGDEIETWIGSEVGELVTFTATMPLNDDPISSRIKLSNLLDNSGVVLMLGRLTNCTKINVCH